MAQWTTAEEVINRWAANEAPEADDVILTTFIEDAEVLIETRYPAIQNRIDSGSLNIRLVRMVIASMVQRAYQRALDGKTNYSYTTGPFSESGSYGDAARGLYLTAEEINLLAPSGINVPGKAFSIDLDRGQANFRIGDDSSAPGVFGPNVWIPVTKRVWADRYGD